MRFRHLTENKKVGSYVGVRLTSDSTARLVGWMNSNLIIEPQPADKIHVTLVLSKDGKIGHHPISYAPPIPIDPKSYSLDVFGEDKDVLVLKFESEFLQKRHMQLRKKFNLDWDWPDYSPHITLSTRVQEIRTEFEPPEFELELSREYVEEFNPDASD